MSRPLRIDIENGIYHVTSRGWERRVIVRDDRDREQWLNLLDRVAVRCGWQVLAWTLLDNHFHVFLRTPEANLSAGMHDLNSGYASTFNRRYRRSGSLFQGRFKAVLVENDSHALELTRYVHLNSVRAGIVDRPEEYRWSSYGGYLGSHECPCWLACGMVLSELGRNRSRCRLAYRRFVEAGLCEKVVSPLASAVGGVFLGASDWVEGMRRELAEQPAATDVPQHRRLAWRPGVADVVAAVGEAFRVEGSRLQESRRHGNDARLAAVYLSRQLTDERVAAIGEHFGGVSAAAVSKAVSRADKRRAADRRWDRLLSQLTRHLTNPEGRQPSTTKS